MKWFSLKSERGLDNFYKLCFQLLRSQEQRITGKQLIQSFEPEFKRHHTIGNIHVSTANLLDALEGLKWIRTDVESANGGLIMVWPEQKIIALTARGKLVSHIPSLRLWYLWVYLRRSKLAFPFKSIQWILKVRHAASVAFTYLFVTHFSEILAIL